MIVRKVRGEDKVGKITLFKFEYDLIKKLSLPVEMYIKESLINIAKKRRWKWYFKKENT